MTGQMKRSWLERASLLTVALSATANALSFPGEGHQRRDASEGTHWLSKRNFDPINGDQVQKSYDYVVAGGGLAGLVLASRLSEDPQNSVLVLEAGMTGDDVAAGVDAPAGAYYSSIVGGDYDWKYYSTNQVHTNNRVHSLPRGMILGGSSAMNAMYLVRPSELELDAWAEMLATDPDTAPGADRWNWDNMFEAMKKSETFHAPLEEAHAQGGDYAVSPENHGTDGPMHLTYPAVNYNGVSEWIEALNSTGIPPSEDINGGVTMGGFVTPSSINPENWTRSYSRTAYINPLSPRKNLHVLAEATVTRFGFSDRERVAVGAQSDTLIANRVEFVLGRNDRAKYVIGVNKELVLSAGPFGSPKILMHSGVGPQDVLDNVGVDVTIPLPGVGQHATDHMTAGVTFEAAVETIGDIHDSGSDFSRTPEAMSMINNLVAFLPAARLFGDEAALQEEIRDVLTRASENNGTGIEGSGLSMATLVPGGSPEVIEGYRAMFNLTVDRLWDSAQVEFLASFISPGVVSIQSAVQHPLSRGRFYINSTDPMVPIIADPNFFSVPTDRTIMRQGIKVIREVGIQLAELGVIGQEIRPGLDVQTDEALDAWLTNDGASTQYHTAGTCAMLPRRWGGVVDSHLRVYGTANVRVVDSSVYPYEFAAHLASATFAVAESAADLLKEDDESFTVPNSAKIDESQLGRVGSSAIARAGFIGFQGVAGVVCLTLGLLSVL